MSNKISKFPLKVKLYGMLYVLAGLSLFTHKCVRALL